MNSIQWSVFLGLAAVATLTASVRAQSRPYVAYVYPAGGQQGTTFEVKVGGQNLAEDSDVLVSGQGVTAKVVQYCNPIGNRESAILSQQLRDLQKSKAKLTPKKNKAAATSTAAPPTDPATDEMITKIAKVLREEQRRPACAAFRGVAFIEVTIARDAPPGERELRFVSARSGASNPMVFHVGQLPEYSRKPMLTAPRQILGKEAQALRNRPASEAQERVNIPCTVNGQIASREVNGYRFAARKGQRIVITTQARQLVPYIADAVPGWFQPVLALYDADGKEVAYDDDYRFKPDPVILYEVPKDGEYVLEIFDSIYRGRNDFIYRITIGELPFVTSIFPLGASVGESVPIKMKGWNLGGAEITPPPKDPGVHQLVANRNGTVSNPIPFARDTLPEILEKESNDTIARAQKVTLPVIVNGRIGKADDWDVFQFKGKANDSVVVEVYARRLDSPVDSVVKLTDAKGKLIGFNDDCEDLGSGVNTHHADSYFTAKLPADGAYYVHMGDTGRHGGEDYGYRLRISAPRPDFALRVVPSSAALAPKGVATLSVYAIRKDGFDGDITLTLKDPSAGFSLSSIGQLKPPKKTKGSKTPPPGPSSGTVAASQAVAKIQIKSSSTAPHDSADLHIEGRAKVGDQEIAREAVPAEDRMQAFLWRHMVPAQDLMIHISNRKSAPATPQRVPPPLTPDQLAKAEAVVKDAEAKGRKFSKSQVTGLARRIKDLYEQGLLTDRFYGDKIAELGYVQ